MTTDYRYRVLFSVGYSHCYVYVLSAFSITCTVLSVAVTWFGADDDLVVVSVKQADNIIPRRLKTPVQDLIRGGEQKAGY